MKAVLILAIAALALAQRQPVAKEIAEVRDEIKQFPGTSLIVLYDAGASQSRTDALIKDVQDKLLTQKGAEQYNFFKTEVPVDALKKDDKKHDPERFIDELQINPLDLKHAPTLVATRKGWAFWAHGDGAVDSVNAEIKSFDAKARASNPHALKAKQAAAAGAAKTNTATTAPAK